MKITKALQRFCSQNQNPKRTLYNVTQQVEGDFHPDQINRFIYPNAEHIEKKYSLYNIISCPANFITQSKFFIDFIASLQPKDLNCNQDYFVPPKIHENSVFVYQSRNKSNAFRSLRSFESVVLLAAVFFTKNPLYTVPFAAFWYAIWGNAWVYEATRRNVVRMDIMPHLEMMSFQKVGPFGTIYTKLVKISDLEKLPYEEEQAKLNYFWIFQKNTMDRNMIFRDKSTGEQFLFDQQGYWSEEGLAHPLIY